MESNRWDWLKKQFYNLSSGFIAYSKKDAKKSQRLCKHLPIWIASNSSVSQKDCFYIKRNPSEINNIIFVGQLGKRKKLPILLIAFKHAIENDFIPVDSNLIVVGDGPESESLRKSTKRLNISNRVNFAGTVIDINLLRELYSHALFSIAPGQIGLSATQSLAFGVPLILAQNEFTGPEVEPCVQGENAIYFKREDPTDLSQTLRKEWNKKDYWISQRSTISNKIKTEFSIENMVTHFRVPLLEAQLSKK